MRSEPLFAAGNAARPLVVRRSARARRMRLSVDPRDGAVRLTLPARASLASGYAWAESKRGWIEATLGRLPPPAPLAIGDIVPFEGGAFRLHWQLNAPRRIVPDGDRIVVGGPEDMAAARVLRWLRGEALARLTAESMALAAAAGVRLGRVAVGDARTRWGSCASSGDIRYSWRLILAPPEVRRATVAHEVAHLLHMDHSPAFHAAVARLFGRDPKAERAWLRANGARLQAFARG